MDLSVKEYAKEHKISIYQVIRKIQRGELEGFTKEINGQRVQFVKDANKSHKKESKISSGQIDSTKESANLVTKEDIEYLKSEIRAIREEIIALRELLKS